MTKVNVGIEASSWINIAAGIALAGLAYYLARDVNGAYYSGLASGVILVAVGAYTAWAAATQRSGSTLAASALSLLVGMWSVGYPWFTAAISTYVYASAAVGIVVIVVSGYELYAAGRARGLERGPLRIGGLP